MNMKMKTGKSFTYWLEVAAVGIVLGLVLQGAKAWTEPTAVPPEGNVGAPLNTSDTGQVKMGPLGINSSVVDPFNQVGLTVGGKAMADDFCLNGNPAECLSNAGGGPGTMAFCNSVDTMGRVSWLHDGYDWQGSGRISLLKGGKNICEDSNGCTYRIWRYNANKPAGTDFYTTYPVMFRQIEDGHWHDAQGPGGGNTGINGNSEVTKIVNWGTTPNRFNLYDDKDLSYGGGWSPRVTDVENSPDELVWNDSDGSSAFILTICDY